MEEVVKTLNTETRLCRLCHEEKAVTEFPNGFKNKDGTFRPDNRCRECKNRLDIEWRSEHQGYSREYYHFHKEDFETKYHNVAKRCPSCNKKISVRKHRESPFRVCSKCRIKLRVSHTLNANPNHDTAGGIRLKVAA